jgi:predicted transcriptional regulator
MAEEKSKRAMKRPSLFVVKELLETIRKNRLDKDFSMCTFSYLLGSPVSNRHDLSAYLRLLVELGWLVKKQQKDFVGKRTIFEVSDKGIKFLRLFPKKNAVTKS